MLSVILVGCSEGPPPKVAEPQPILQNEELRFPAGNPQLPLLVTTAAKPAEAIPIDLPAHLVWNEDRTQRIYAPLAGRVASIHTDLGRPVRKGDTLLSLHSPEFGSAQADAAKAMADFRFSEKNLLRQKELLDAGIVARKDFEQAEADTLRAKAEADRAIGRVNVYGSHSMVNQRLALTSDLAGIVVEKNVNPGQEVRPEQFGPGALALFVISDPSSLWVQIDAQEADLNALKPGASFELIVAALDGKKFKGRVVASADMIDPNTRTIKVRGLIENPDRVLKAEMLGTARVNRNLGQGLVVPASAVLLRGTQHLVFVKKGADIFVPRIVKLSYIGSQVSIVSSGLEVNEEVVSENSLLLAREFRIAEDAAKITAAQNAKSADSK
ncbi:MAG: efflux RND transporter periplasmic adaptor subunit [Burkholderiales bacterium]|nr:efflux RND transporter periplasmic adaptor subunit [Burkholderiales bacterium]